MSHTSRAADQARPDIDLAKHENALGSHLATVYAAKRVVIATFLAFTLFGLLYVLFARPVYEADVLIQVEEKSGGLKGLGELSALIGSEAPAETEIQILRSRSLLGAVVDQLALDVEVEPRYFPLVGHGIARRRTGVAPRSALLGLDRYAWGGERIRVTRLEVPQELENEELVLRVAANGQFELDVSDGVPALQGRVGTALSGTVGSAGAINIFVSELSARPGTEFIVRKLPRASVMRELQKDLVIKEKGEQTGVISVSLTGTDPSRVSATVDTLAKVYLRQNVERRSEEAERTLQFINAQLPELKDKVDEAEAALNSYRAKKGSVDVGMEAQALLERAAEVEKGITVLALERSELQQRFTAEHPALAATREKLSGLHAERASLNGQLKRLPETELNSARLKRDVKVANELYLLLLNKSQELRVVKSGTVGNVRILDFADRPRIPIQPRALLTLLLSALLGLTCGVGATIGWRTLNPGVLDPMVLEKQLGLSLYATIPHSSSQHSTISNRLRSAGGSLPLLAEVNPADMAIESLRSLRTSIQFALMDSKNNLVAITGPSPSVGKSFISANLAHVLASAGKRTLLIDADMRRGKLHQYFAVERGPGLAELLLGETERKSAVRPAVGGKFDFLATGNIPANPSELLLSPRFSSLLEELGKGYDIVLIDTPPILAVTDPAIIGRMVGVNLFVARAGAHSLREIATAVSRLDQSGVRVNGVIFNDAQIANGGSLLGKYSYHYQYDYR